MHISLSHKDLGVTQSLHGNVYKVVNYEGQVTVCNYNFTLVLMCHRSLTSQPAMTVLMLNYVMKFVGNQTYG